MYDGIDQFIAATAHQTAVPITAEAAEMQRVTVLLDRLFVDDGQLDFATLQGTRKRVFISDMAFRLHLIRRYIDLMRAQGATRIYIVTSRRPAFAMVVPDDCQTTDFSVFLNALAQSPWWCLLDSNGVYCLSKVAGYFYHVVGPQGAVEQPLDWEFWLDYHTFTDTIAAHNFNDWKFCALWPEIVKARDALQAVQAYWKVTGFAPPPRSPAEAAMKLIVEKSWIGELLDPKRYSTAERRVQQLARATCLPEDEVLLALNDKVVDLTQFSRSDQREEVAGV